MVAKYMYKFSQENVPDPITQIITFNDNIYTHDPRNRSKPHITQRRISFASNSLRHKGHEIWYSIPVTLNSMKTIKSFIKHLKKQLINTY